MLTYAITQSAVGTDASSEGHAIKVLLVSDGVENLTRVRSLLRLSQYAITYAHTAEELSYACQDFYDFAVVDVGPEHLAYALREIRASANLQNIAVLVRAERFVQSFQLTSVFAKHNELSELNSERLAQDFTLTSVFTKYRAMPGSDTELAQLVLARTHEKSLKQKQRSNVWSEGHSAL